MARIVWLLSLSIVAAFSSLGCRHSCQTNSQCGTDIGDDDPTDTTGTGSTNSGSDSQGTESGSDSGSDTDTGGDPCRVHDGQPYPWEACPSQCQYFELSHTWNGCSSSGSSPSVCYTPTADDIPFGQVIYDPSVTDPSFLIAPCGTGTAIPDGFVTCNGSSGEPTACTCFCDDPLSVTGCPWNNDHAQMVDCGLPEPCDTYEPFSSTSESTGPCMLNAMLNGEAALLHLRQDQGDGAFNEFYYVLGNGEVLWNTATEHFSDGGCATRPPTHGTLQRCQPMADSFFEDCLANDWQACFGDEYGEPPEGGGLWVQNCVPAEPTCP